ncbi:hypothetical protein GGTG_02594 [Gaeumannomyces tritici R3-111a-1]|uniref:Uncharacterized protein n=1 Tax=Gaeumannomyces tritici (strain R3-111a-1) TaxID=644352 RepID=J3NMT4_GAET3|nr:hypothetical protein GGTG_02594 [Gaeumannomyces tritici R3-111a-1]EJT77485.1 hypothetical protein GGTG_02594 [Gaeumannomyces tritici R3-111a-1]
MVHEAGNGRAANTKRAFGVSTAGGDGDKSERRVGAVVEAFRRSGPRGPARGSSRCDGRVLNRLHGFAHLGAWFQSTAYAAGAAQQPIERCHRAQPRPQAAGDPRDSVRALLLPSVAVDTSASGKAARAAVAAEVDPVDGQGCSRS